MSTNILTLTALLATAGLLLLRGESDELLFSTWKGKYGKSYSSAEEQARRLLTYSANLRAVLLHNANYKIGAETYEMELNQFADLTTEEFAALYLMAPRQLTNTGKCTMSVPDVNIPAELDWTTSGAVTGVKNQGQCGSCWAFSSTGALEGLYFNTNKKLISFSEQQLVDCSTAYGNAGCNGGLMNQTFWYVKDNGITTEDKYAYTGANGKCKYTSAMEVFRNKDCAEITVNSEKSLTTALGTGPVSVAIQANQLGFQLYKKGVFSGNCGHNLDHGVLAVGFGTENGQKYYKVKNSWGATWGLNGFILMARNGDGPGQCGIQMAATLPL